MIRCDMKKFFFDRKAVTSRTDKATRKVLSKFGAYTRTRSRTSIRQRKGTSRPGQQPYSHTGLLKDKIFFGYDPNKRSVVVGPEKLRKGKGEAPRLLEHGGKTTTRFFDSKRKKYGKPRRVRVAKRPYMQPAFDTELKQLPPKWRDSVK